MNIFYSLRFRLVLLILLAFFPAFGLSIYTVNEQRQQAKLLTQNITLQITKTAAENITQLIEITHQQLILVNLIPQVYNIDDIECPSILAKVKEANPFIANLGIAGNNGDLLCSAVTHIEPVNYSDRDWFQRAISEKTFIVSEYVIGRVTKVAILPIALPIISDTGEVTKVVFAAIDLSWVQKSIMEGSQLPPGSSITFVDKNGTILSRNPEPELWVGKTVTDTPIVQTILQLKKQGTTESRGVDGKTRLYAFTPVDESENPAFVFVGIPSDVAYAQANQLLINNLIGLGIVTALMLVAVWVGTEFLVLRQVRDLLSAIKKLSSGNFKEHIHVSSERGEINLLTSHFNKLAIALQNREAQLKENNKILEEEINQRKRAEDNIQRQLQRLVALREIDRAISGSVDLHITLKVFLMQVCAQLKVDAADVLLLKSATQTLEFSASQGFKDSTIARTRLKLGEGYAGRAGLEKKTIAIPDLSKADPPFIRQTLLKEENLVSYFALPLTAKGVVKGVLEIFHRSRLDPDQDWLDFMETLAGQAAIALDNAELFDGMHRSNINLTLAYDATIEGWSKAMDLRDKETEGHSLRVTDMTIQLARRLGMQDDEEIAHVRRGALLHDMGKIGIPDAILLKPDKLTDEEWVLMRKHPQLAFEMLSPINYLKPALDIPYCHHEKWDGSGYPQGLKGEMIPLAARIFAIVDVWDALTSDRPYRKAWTKEEAIEHIKEQSGKHFDPKVVEEFLKIVPVA